MATTLSRAATATILIAGGAGDDELLGNAGDDVLDGGTGIDDLTGGLGNDIYFTDNALDVVIEGANPGTDEIRTPLNINLVTAGLANIENVTLLGIVNLKATGNALNNVIKAMTATIPSRAWRATTR